MPSVSVIVLNFNGQKYAYDCINSILNTDYANLKIFFVDNASTDDSVKIAKSFGRVEIVRMSENCGTLARNIGAGMANGEYIAFLDVDTTVHKDWLKEAVKTMNREPNVGAVQALIFFMNCEEVWCDAGFIDCYGRCFTKCNKAHHDDAYEILYPTSAAVVIRKKALDLVGGFDPDFFVYYEDTDLGWRLRKCGYKILLAPTSIVYHAVHGSTRQIPHFTILFHEEKNRIMMLLKNLDTPYLLRYALPIIAIRFFFAIYCMLTGRIQGKVITKALLWNLVNLKKNLAKRFRLRPIKKCSDEELIRSKLLLRPNLFSPTRARIDNDLFVMSGRNPLEEASFVYS